jgi:hypothetical protein
MILIQFISTSGSINVSGGFGFIQIYRGASATGLITGVTSSSAPTVSPIVGVDFPSAGTYTYKIYGQTNSGSNTLSLNEFELVVFEL